MQEEEKTGSETNETGSSDFAARLKDKNDSKAASDGNAGGSSKGLQGMAQVGFNMASRNRKKLAAGGAGAGLIALLITAAIALLPLKLESMMKNISGKAFGTAENAVERRGERITLRFLLRESAKAGISDETAVVATGSIVSDLYRNMKLNNFKTKFEAANNLKILSAPEGGGRIIVESLEGPRLASANSFDEFLGKNLSTADARRFMNQALKDQTHFLQVLKRRHLRSYMRNAYGIRKWKIFDKKKGKEATTNLDAELGKNELGSYTSRITRSISCLLSGTNCPDPAKPREPDGNNQGQYGDKPLPTEDPANPATRTQISEAGTTGEITTGVTDAAKVAADEVAKGTATARLKDTIVKLSIKKIVGSAAAAIGIIDTLSQIDKAVTEDTIPKIIADKNAAQYATEYASWAVMNDQILAGGASGDEVNAAMLKLKDMEQSNGFQRLYSGKDTGTKMTSDEMVNNDQGAVARFDTFYRSTFGSTLSPILAAYRNSIGGIFSSISGLFSDLIAPILSAIPGADTALAKIGELAGNIIGAIISPVLDGSETGAVLFNAIDAGGQVTANDFTRDTLGGSEVSPAAYQQINEQIAAENTAELNKQPLLAQLTNTDVPNSFASKFLAWMPGTAQEATDRSTTYIASLFINPAKFFSNNLLGILPGAHAAGALDPNPYGIRFYALSESQLSAPLNAYVSKTPAAQINPTDCKDPAKNPTAGKPDDTCLVDIATVQSMNSTYTTADDGGLQSGSSSTPSTPTTAAGTPPNGGAATGTSAQLATQLLSNPNFVLPSYNDGVKSDLTATSLNQPINNSDTCGNSVTIAPDLLQLLINTTQKYKITPNNIITGHGCDTALHPMGRAFDLNLAVDLSTGKSTNFSVGTAGDDQAIDRDFFIYEASLFAIRANGAKGGGLGQSLCPGRAGAPIPQNVTIFDDTCNHQHVDIRLP